MGGVLDDRQGEPVDRQTILDRVWGFGAYPTTRTVDNFILALRKIVEEDPKSPRHILTVHGIGYRMVLDPDTHIPFFGGTYFPNEARYGMPSFGDLLRKAMGTYAEGEGFVLPHSVNVAILAVELGLRADDPLTTVDGILEQVDRLPPGDRDQVKAVMPVFRSILMIWVASG